MSGVGSGGKRAQTGPASSGLGATGRAASTNTAASATDAKRLPPGAARPEAGPGEVQTNSAALALLSLQAELRKVASRFELGYFIANEARAPLRTQQIFVLEAASGDKISVHTVSSLANVERTSPLVLWLESALRELKLKEGLEAVREFDATAYASGHQATQGAYPLRHLLWVPWLDRSGKAASGMLLARASPWMEPDVKIATYLGGAFGHAWYALERPGRAAMLGPLLSRRTALLAGLAALALLLIPVPMTALAPVEVVPRQTLVVTPGIDGVIAGVHVEPNAVVRSGQLLVTLSDTIPRNRAEIAEREVVVAEAKYKKATQLAFLDARGRHEMAIARSDLDLKLAERDYARELLKRTRIVAERDGVAFFTDKRDLAGKPVVVGEKLMEVADPEAVELRIELPAADAIVIRERARVKVFLDSSPLDPIGARLIRASYKAALREGQQFAFRLVAEVDAGEAAKLRLGARGTAQVFSDQVSLGFYLFRRPIAAARQWLGL